MVWVYGFDRAQRQTGHGGDGSRDVATTCAPHRAAVLRARRGDRGKADRIRGGPNGDVLPPLMPKLNCLASPGLKDLGLRWVRSSRHRHQGCRSRGTEGGHQAANALHKILLRCPSIPGLTASRFDRHAQSGPIRQYSNRPSTYGISPRFNCKLDLQWADTGRDAPSWRSAFVRLPTARCAANRRHKFATMTARREEFEACTERNPRPIP